MGALLDTDMTYQTPYSRTPHVTFGLLISQKTMFSFLRFHDVMGTIITCQFVMKFFLIITNTNCTHVFVTYNYFNIYM